MKMGSAGFSYGISLHEIAAFHSSQVEATLSMHDALVVH